MLAGTMEEALNRQLNAELYSGYLYLSMSTFCSQINMPGFAHWLRTQRLEEITHGMKFYDYIIARGGRVTLGAIDGPPTEWDSPIDVAESILAHEKKVTGLIHELYELSQKEKDHATSSFLQWFIDEQVEEEEGATDLVERLKAMQDAPGGIVKVDDELAQRQFKAMPMGIHGGVG
jgi:ferritin